MSTQLSFLHPEAEAPTPWPADGKFPVILADPAWRYNSRCQHSKTKTKFGGGAGAHYPTMSDKEIMALDVKNIAAKNAVLFIWATGPKLGIAMKVITAWGFIYKTTGFVWQKMNKRGLGLFFGVGFYSKSNAEICLLATRGKSLKPRTNKVSSAVLTPLQEHSRKPEAVSQRIELMYPDLPKLEMFARRVRPSWSHWGNEVESDVKL